MSTSCSGVDERSSGSMRQLHNCNQLHSTGQAVKEGKEEEEEEEEKDEEEEEEEVEEEEEGGGRSTC